MTKRLKRKYCALRLSKALRGLPQRVTKLLRGWRRRIKRHPQLLFVLGLFSLFLSIVLLALNPGQHPFEVQLVASRLSFVTDEPLTHFLKDIRPVPVLTINGKASQDWILSGQFLSAEAKGFKDLTIKLPYEESSISLKPVKSGRATDQCSIGDLEIDSLQLSNNTEVSTLSYQSYRRRLRMSFKQNEQVSPDSLGFLELNLNNCLELTIAGYKIPELGWEESDTTKALTLQFIPNSSGWEFPLPKVGTLDVELPTIKGNPDNAHEWFWGDLEVKDVKFLRQRNTGLGIDEAVDYSSIQKGLVRMVDQELEIAPNQFLITKQPGIQKIRTFQILDDGDDIPQGIGIRAIGQTSQVQVGLDESFPIRGIRSNILAQIFPPNTMVAIVSFSGAMVATLLSWLVDNLFKSSE